MASPVRESVSPLARIHDEIDRMFQEFTSARFWPRLEGVGRVPSIDLYEKDGNLIVEAELPGIDRKDVKISYTDSALTIQGESRQEKEEKREGYYRSERQYGSFFRTVPLPAPVDFSRAKAEFENGLLRVTLPRSTQTAEQERTIPIAG